MSSSEAYHTLPCHEISVREMYDISNKQHGAWGIAGYKVPKEYLDTRELKEAKGAVQHKAPKATKKGDFLSAIMKASATLPSPNQYNIVKPWCDETKKPNAPKNVGKRTTYIEEIAIEAKRRPMPGVGTYDLAKSDKGDKKQSSPNKNASERVNFLCEYEYVSNTLPGPGNYNPREIQTKIREVKMKPEDWRKKHTDQSASPKKPSAPEVGTYSPQPVGFQTFDKMLEKHIAQKGASKVKNWGGEVRFDFDKKNKKPVLVPGPGQYDLVPNWALESPKAKKDAKEHGTGIFSKISKGISKSIYYS